MAVFVERHRLKSKKVTRVYEHIEAAKSNSDGRFIAGEHVFKISDVATHVSDLSPVSEARSRTSRRMFGALYDDGIELLACLVATQNRKLQHRDNGPFISNDLFERFENLYERLDLRAKISYRPLIISEGLNRLM